MRLTYSNVVSTIALVAAVGGGATAGAAALSRNSVGTAQIRDRSVHVRDLATTARPTSRARIAAVVTDTMTSSDVLSALSTAVKGQVGEAGPAGPAGPAGAPGVADVAVREATGDPVAGAGFAAAVAHCEPGERVLGGGGRFDADGSGAATITQSYPDGEAWAVEVHATDAGRAHAFAVCAKIGA